MKTKKQAAEAVGVLRQFIGQSQLHCLVDACRGEEKQYFFDKLCEMEDLVKSMPVTYQTDGPGDRATVYLHYFARECDWWIREKDKEAEQHQAFGWASLNGYEPELGYISIIELLSCGAELDLHFAPRPWSEVKKELAPEPAECVIQFEHVMFPAAVVASAVVAAPIVRLPWRR